MNYFILNLDRWIIVYSTAAVQLQRREVICEVLPHLQPNSHIQSKIDVLAVTEYLWRCFHAVEIQIRRETNEGLFESGSDLELQTLLKIPFWNKERF